VLDSEPSAPDVIELSPGNEKSNRKSRRIVTGVTLTTLTATAAVAAFADLRSASLRAPKSDVSQAILAAANSITATVCRLTVDRPADVCN
jgi:hypothetical protein